MTGSIPPLQLQLDKELVTIEVGGTEPLNLRNGSGAVPAGATVIWSSSDPAVAGVEPVGLVRGVGAGDATITVTVTYQNMTGRVSADVSVRQIPARIRIVSGNDQTGKVGAPLAQPIRVEIADARGQPVRGVNVHFVGRGSASAPFSRDSATTAADGVAVYHWTLGPEAGTQTLRVSVGSRADLTAEVPVKAAAGEAARLVRVAGDVQEGPVGAILAETLRVRATDTFGNAVAGAAVAWLPRAESGEVLDALATTDSSGHATAAWRLGARVGEQRMTASSTVGDVHFTAAAARPITARVSITGGGGELSAIGATTQLTATAYSSSETVVSDATPVWASLTPEVASVSSAGLITAVANGSARIAATVDGKADTVTLTVRQAVTYIEVSPSLHNMNPGSSAQLSFTALDAGRTPVPGLTPAWSSSAPSVATVSASGMVLAVAAGTVQITARVGSQGGTATIIVAAPPPPAAASVVITPASAELGAGDSVRAVAVVRDVDARPIDGAVVTWSTSNAAAAVVSDAGVVRAIAAGSAVINASSGVVSGSLAVTVRADDGTIIASVLASPVRDTIKAIGHTARFTATARNAQGSTVDGANFEWTSLHASIATAGGDGTVTAKATGTALIVATALGCSGCAADTVSVFVMQEPALVALDASSIDLQSGATHQLAVGVRDAAGVLIPDAPVSWTVSPPGVVTVSAAGLVTGQSDGSATVSATSGGFRGETRVVVGGRMHRIPAAIVDDCSVDVTKALHDWIGSVPDNSTLDFGRDACYRIDGGLVINDRNGLTFEGNGSTFRVFTEGHGQRANWIFQGGSNLTLRNMIARGANPNAGLAENAYVRRLEWQHGYRLRGVQGAVLENVQAYDVYGDYVNLSHDARVAFPGPPNRNIVVRGGRFERNGRYGITVTNGEDILFENNYLGETRWSHINVELNGPTEAGRNIRIEGNRFGPVNHFVFVSAGNGFSGRVGDIVFRGNVMETESQTCLAPIAMHAPAALNPDGSQIFWSGLVVENNVFRVPTGGWAVDLARIRDVVIRNNEVTSNTHWGCQHDHPVRLVDGHNISITGNTFRTVYLAHGRFWRRIFAADELTSGVRESGNVVN